MNRWLARSIILATCGGALETMAQTEIAEDSWGVLADGRAITRYTLTNSAGARASFMPLGAAVLAVEAPDRNGRLADVVLGFDTPEEYL